MAAFQFFPSYWDALSQLPDDQVGKVVRAMCTVTFDGGEPSLEGIPALVFSVIRPTVESSYERSLSGSKGGRKAGRGRPSKGSSEIAYQANPEEPIKLNRNSLIAERNGTERNGVSNSPQKAPSKRFIPPTVEDVESYLREANIVTFTAEEFVSYYTGNGWKVGKNQMKDWKATCRSWNSRRKKDSSGYRRSGEPASYSPQLFEG